MKAYINAVLDRLDNEINHSHTVTPRTFSPGEYIGIMIMVVECEGKIIGVRGDKFNDFLLGTCDEHIEKLKVNLGCTMLEIIEIDDDHYHARAVIDKKMWEKLYGEMPMPEAPVFKSLKPRNTLQWNYEQIQNFLWASVKQHPANPIPHEENNPCYLDIEYFIRLTLGDRTYFTNSLYILTTYILHFTGESEEWGKEISTRLADMHQRTIFLQYDSLKPLFH